MKKKILVLLLVLVTSVSFAQLTDAALGKPGSVTISTSGNTLKIDQSTSGSNGVDIDVISSGAVGSTTLTVGLVTPVSIGTLTTGTTHIEITPFDGIVSYGGAGVSGNLGSRIASGTTLRLAVSTTTPTMYFLSVTATQTVHVEHVK